MIKKLKPKNGQERFKLTYTCEITQEQKEFFDKVCYHSRVFVSDEDVVSYALDDFFTKIFVIGIEKLKEMMEQEQPNEEFTPLEALDEDVMPRGAFVVW